MNDRQKYLLSVVAIGLDFVDSRIATFEEKEDHIAVTMLDGVEYLIMIKRGCL